MVSSHVLIPADEKQPNCSRGFSLTKDGKGSRVFMQGTLLNDPIAAGSSFFGTSRTMCSSCSLMLILRYRDSLHDSAAYTHTTR